MKSSSFFSSLMLAGSLIAFKAGAQSAPSPLDAFIKFDAESKEYTAKQGEPMANFVFALTNIGSQTVTISNVATSCGCTVAKLPSQPWTIPAGEGGEIHATMNLAGKPPGTTTKTLTVNSDKGIKVLFVKSTVVPPAPAATTDSGMNRTENQKLAIADRQAVFKGDCASCHVEKAKDKMGPDLFVAACGICHESEHRATMVPDLHKLPEPTNAEFWRNWITHGKPGTLMPAFAKAEGGFLTTEQIESLVFYLAATIPSRPTAQLSQPAPTAH